MRYPTRPLAWIHVDTEVARIVFYTNVPEIQNRHLLVRARANHRHHRLHTEKLFQVRCGIAQITIRPCELGANVVIEGNRIVRLDGGFLHLLEISAFGHSHQRIDRRKADEPDGIHADVGGTSRNIEIGDVLRVDCRSGRRTPDGGRTRIAPNASEMGGPGKQSSAFTGIHLKDDPELLEIVDAARAPRRFPRAGQRGEQDRRQNADDRYHHQ